MTVYCGLAKFLFPNAHNVYMHSTPAQMILYGTVMATEAGPVKFFDDIYGHDRQLATLLGI